METFRRFYEHKFGQQSSVLDQAQFCSPWIIRNIDFPYSVIGSEEEEKKLTWIGCFPQHVCTTLMGGKILISVWKVIFLREIFLINAHINKEKRFEF